jgi:hypothetical protein
MHFYGDVSVEELFRVWGRKISYIVFVFFLTYNVADFLGRLGQRQYFQK